MRARAATAGVGSRAPTPRTCRRALVGLVWLAAACGDGPVAVAPIGSVDLATPWVVAAPELVGLDSDELYVAGELAGRIDRMRSLLVVGDGRLVLERYYGGWTADTPADVRSVTKSVVSTLTGIALEQGLIRSLDQPITDFLSAPEFDVRLEHARVTVRHLLTMTSGFAWTEIGASGYNEWIRSGDHVDDLLARPFASEPGESFTYNSAAVHLLGVLVEKAAGRPLAAYADEVLFSRLGIGERAWETLSSGYDNGSSGLDLRPRDLARFGQLWLQRGWSAQRSVVPEPWVEDATSRKVADLPGVGPVGTMSYGYLWWLDRDHDAFFAWGFGGQFVYVVPRHRLVVVATTEWRGVEGDIGSGPLQEEVMGIVVDRVLGAVR